MELVINSRELEETSEQENPFAEPSNFLNSNYKTVVKQSLKNASSKSIFGLRRRIKNSRYKYISTAEVSIKVILFFGILVVLYS
jgi:hypothetical protein